MKRQIRVIHLSDLHFRKDTDVKFYRRLNNALRKEEIPPDIFLVSGDLVDNNSLKLKNSKVEMCFKNAHDYLVELCKEFSLDPQKRLFIVPGNHDVGPFGNKYSKESHELFNNQFGPYSESKHINIDGRDLIVGCFNSNITKGSINFANGELTDAELEKFENKLANIEKKISLSAYKIALLHHHPMPVLRSEYSKSLKLGRFVVIKESMDQERFLVLNNSATFMAEMLNNGVDLIFHGHKHHRGAAKASFPLYPEGFRNIAIISAGSIGQYTDEKELSFNIVDIIDNGQVNVNFHVKRAAAAYRKGPDSITIFNEREARHNRFEASKRLALTSSKKTIFSDAISADWGTWTRHILNEEWVPTRTSTKKKIHTEIRSRSGLFTEIPQIEVTSSETYNAEWEPDGKPDKGRQKGVYSFNQRPMSKSDPINAEIKIEIPNAVSFTKEQRLGFTKNEKEEKIGWDFSNVLPEHLVWRIKFPVNLPPIKPTVRVMDDSKEIDESEQLYCLNNFNYLKKSNELLLDIEYPLPNKEYAIIWNLPTEGDLREETMVSAKMINDFETIREFLLGLKKEDSLDNGIIGKWFNEISNEIVDLKFVKTKYKNIALEISLAVLDEKKNEIRYVGFSCPKCEDQMNSSIWKQNTAIGHLIPGYVYKSKRAVFKPYPKGPHEAIKPYLRKAACISDNIDKNQKNTKDYLKAFFAIPLNYPIESDHVIAVLELATCERHKLLYELHDEKRAEKLAKRVIIGNLVNKKFKSLIEKEGVI